MAFLKHWWVSIILLLFCIAISIFCANAAFVEQYYSLKIYPAIGYILRTIFGWLPFSLGDVLYACIAIWLIANSVRGVKCVVKKKYLKANFKTILNKIFIFGATIYIVFYIFWGINYNRIGIANQLSLQINAYTVKELKQINDVLVTKVNICKTALLLSTQAYPTNKNLYKKVDSAYVQLANVYPFLKYKPTAIKTSLWGWFGNYAGFTGYYNPFTGEAQVNTTGPKYTQGYTACHEVAHQLGYAKEMEANFVGYLAAHYSGDTLLLYSCYTSLLSYANRTLYFADTTSAMQYRRQLLPAVQADYKSVQQFNAAHKSIIEPIVGFVYNKFLQSNQQPLGLLSYDEVTAFLIAYYKKFGDI